MISKFHDLHNKNKPSTFYLASCLFHSLQDIVFLLQFPLTGVETAPKSGGGGGGGEFILVPQAFPFLHLYYMYIRGRPGEQLRLCEISYTIHKKCLK